MLSYFGILIVGNNDFGDDGAIELAPAIKELKSLSILYLGIRNACKLAIDDDDIGLEGIQALAPAIKGLTSLTELHVSI